MAIITRRSALVGGIASLFVAPAIVRAASIMPVKVIAPFEPHYVTAVEIMARWRAAREDAARYIEEAKRDASYYQSVEWTAAQILSVSSSARARPWRA